MLRWEISSRLLILSVILLQYFPDKSKKLLCVLDNAKARAIVSAMCQGSSKSGIIAASPGLDPNLERHQENTLHVRVPDNREYCYERLKNEFELIMSPYDLSRRLQVLTRDFLSHEMIAGKTVLEAGCGLGHFSEQLKARGARVTACDIGAGLLKKTFERVGCETVNADVLTLKDKFGSQQFDLVLSSECIEHTPNPQRAVAEMIRVLRPGGYLVLSTPNRLWQPIVRMASRIGARPFDGYENISTFSGLRRVLRDNNAEILRQQGLHLFPFQLGFHRASLWCDINLQSLRGLMINICILAIKIR